MKITTTTKSLSKAPKNYTRVEFEEGARTYVKEKGERQTLVIGVGKKADVTHRKFITLVRNMVRTAKDQKLARIAVAFDKKDFPKLADKDEKTFYSCIAENIQIAAYEFTTYKTTKKKDVLSDVLLCNVSGNAASQGVSHGTTVGIYTNHSRDMANTPGGDMTPKLLANMARKLARGTSVKVTVLGKAAISKLKMGAILGVAKGSKEEPQFIILEHKGGKKGEKPLVFVGKGITFDTGGLNLKPSEGILDMHLDMSGGGAVIAAVTCAAKLKVKRNIIGLIPAAENSVSGESFRPGDILRSMSGKTIDVLNTDAEGRLVLADALTYAKRYEPKLVVDVATLTGASLVALGQHASALMTKDEVLQKKLLELGEESGDYLWPLPLWDEYKQYTKGIHGDVANISSHGSPRAGGSINGGSFLSHFADGYPWAHIDMAPRMTSVPSDKLARGATGEPVRLLVAIAERYR